MQVKLNEALKALESLKKINKEKFPIRTSYKLLKILSFLEEEARMYEETARESLLKYVKKDEDGNPIIEKVEQGEKFDISPEDQYKCMLEIEELGNSLIELPNYTFSFEDFGNLEMSIDELSGLFLFIKEEEE